MKQNHFIDTQMYSARGHGEKAHYFTHVISTHHRSVDQICN